jgi:hypothetical protein
MSIAFSQASSARIEASPQTDTACSRIIVDVKYRDQTSWAGGAPREGLRS